MQGMRDLIRGSLSRSLRGLTPLDRVAAAWPVACGTALAARGSVEEIDDSGQVHVFVRMAEWMQPFLSMRSMLAHELSRVSGVPVSEIHFHLEPHTPVRSAAVSQELRAPGEADERR